MGEAYYRYKIPKVVIDTIPNKLKLTFSVHAQNSCIERNIYPAYELEILKYKIPEVWVTEGIVNKFTYRVNYPVNRKLDIVYVIGITSKTDGFVKTVWLNSVYDDRR